ncbi:MAG: hypothetical protein GC145_08915 [Caulobacter sp.]|nr:hypothetical protein [Caulobacter sp.]
MNLAARLERGLTRVSSRTYSLLCAAIVLLAGLALIAALGMQISADGKTYHDQATLLADKGLGAFLGDVLGWSYLGMVSMVALARLVFGEGWATGMIGLNLVCLTATGALIGRLVHRLIDRPWLRLVGLVALPACFEVLMWTRFVCSEPLFTLLMLAALAIAVGPLTPRRWALLAGLLLAATLWRPTGVVLVAALAFAAVLPVLAATLESWRRQPSGRLALALWLGLLLLVALVFAAIMRHPQLWPFGILKAQFDYARWSYDLGQVVWGRLETYHPKPTGYLDYLSIALARWGQAFALWAQGHSLAHRLYNILYLGPVFALSLWALARWSLGADRMTAAQARFVSLAGGAALSFCLLVALLQVEFDWRYRAPALPVFMITALIGAGLAMDAIRRARRPGSPPGRSGQSA